MPEHSDIEREIERSLGERSARLGTPAGGLDDVFERVDRRRDRRRNVAVAGSFAVLGIGVFGIATLRGGEQPAPVADGPGSGSAQTAWVCEGQLDYFGENGDQVYFASCEQTTIDAATVIDNVPTTTVAAVPEPMQETSRAEQVYVAVAGDSLSSIAARFGLAPEVVAAYNSWPDGLDHLIRMGDQILIPPDSLMPEPPVTTLPDSVATTTTLLETSQLPATTVAGGDVDVSRVEQRHVVVVGDSLSSIARRFDVTVDVIVNYNSWQDGVSHLLLPGDIVLIPPGAATAVTATTQP